MQHKSVIATALTVGLVSAWGTAQADQFSVQVSLTDTSLVLNHGYFAYNSNSSGSPFVQVTSVGSISNGTVLTGTAGGAFAAGDAYTFFGDWLDANGAEHLAVVTNAGTAALLTGVSFDASIGALTGVSEATVLSYLDSGSSAAIDAYVQAGFPTAKPYLPTIGTSGVIMGFSNGAPIGTTNPVPEPASFAVLGVGALALLRRKKA